MIVRWVATLFRGKHAELVMRAASWTTERTCAPSAASQVEIVLFDIDLLFSISHTYAGALCIAAGACCGTVLAADVVDAGKGSQNTANVCGQ